MYIKLEFFVYFLNFSSAIVSYTLLNYHFSQLSANCSMYSLSLLVTFSLIAYFKAETLEFQVSCNIFTNNKIK